ncbi:MAG TPA: hypothetical protein VF088_05935 [Pyrinomonadaceae bacterium]
MKCRCENIICFTRRLTGFCVVLLCFVVTTTALAQSTNDGSTANAATGSASSNIEIIKLEWKREVRLPRNFDPSVIPTGATFNDPATRTSGTAPTTATESARAAGPRGSADSAGGTFPATPSRLPVFYVYSMKVKNVGPKQIEGIAWDYLFIDQNLNSEVGRHQFLTHMKIPINKTNTLHSDLRTPPISIVGAPMSGSDKHSRYSERAVIQCVLYEDGSTWKNPLARAGVCEFLKSKYPARQRHTSGQSKQ